MKTCEIQRFFSLIVLTITLLSTAAASEFRLDVDSLPKNGLLIQRLDLGAVIRWSSLDPKKIDGIELQVDGAKIPAQLVLEGAQGCVVAKFPDELIRKSQAGTLACLLKFTASGNAAGRIATEEIVTETPVFKITQTASLQGGLPSRIEFKKTGRVLDSHRWQDRLYHAERRLNVAESKDVRLSLLSDGPICRIVRQEVVLSGSGKTMPTRPPQVVYHWYFFKEYPGLVHVTADYFQPEPVDWRERHFLELHVPDGSFGEYLDVNKSDGKKKFEGAKNTLSAKGAAVLDGPNRIALFGSGNVTVYDGLKTGFGPYMLANGNGAWTVWNDAVGHESSWLLVDAGETDFGKKGEFFAGFERKAGARLSILELEESVKSWTDVARNSLFYAGILKTRQELDACQIDGNRFFVLQSDRLGMMLEKVSKDDDGGGRLVALVDIPSLKLLTPHEPQPLFAVNIREAVEKPEKDKPGFIVRNLTSDRGWKTVDIVMKNGEPSPKNGSVSESTTVLSFNGAAGISNGDAVVLRLTIESHRTPLTNGGAITRQYSESQYSESMIRLTWSDNPVLPDHLTLQSVVLPTIRLAPFGNRMKAFYPQASGIVLDQPFNQNRTWRGRYPSGWSTMPWYAVWDDAGKKEDRVGLYIAAHDKFGSTKEQCFSTNSSTGTVEISLEYPAQDVGRNRARLAPCEIVLKTYRGDWFDAAVMYRDWVRREASWYPRDKMGPEGRTDTPRWMKELSVWAIDGTLPDKMPEVLRRFQKPLGVPTGLHWYNWHKIPFDNDYPHYFPTKEGFKAAVAKIQGEGDLYVMPYINGRLWDTKDRGAEDWLFTKEAFPGVTKKEDGSPYTETYRSVEADGSKVQLGVMCPASKIWVDKQRELIGRLTRPGDGKPGDDGDMGVKGVYVDQVAAASPVLCFDESHGHPLAGGAWWVSEYRKMFEKIRSELPEGAMLTTECNAEPFIDLFDGYLTWHFQHDGQVPAFAAVYGGAVQMFGRAYGGGPDMMIASRMKMAQSFVFGEQIGWIPPHVVNEPQRYDFLKKVVSLRFQFRDYFYKGEMVRPPKLSGEMPTVTADWHFSGYPTIVTLGVVQAGAWRKPAEKSVILLFANFSDKSQENRLEVDLSEWGLEPSKMKIVRHNPDGSTQTLDHLPGTIRVEAVDAFVLELKPLP